MSTDHEIDHLRDGVNCAAVLERLGRPWRLDTRESSRRNLKYRRDKGEVLIVTHEGRGWWDPLSEARGDVFTLVQHLDPSLNFGQVRMVLRRLIGLAPSEAPPAPKRAGELDRRPVSERWNKRPRLRPGCRAWSYLVEQRCLPPAVLGLAVRQDVVRDGAYGSAWFAHRAGDAVSHVEIRGSTFRGSLAGGKKSLFRLTVDDGPATRAVITEAPIDALSFAVIDGTRTGTIYVATGGGIGPGTEAALEGLLTELANRSNACATIATDSDEAGERFARRLGEMAAQAGIRSERAQPTGGAKDWNDVLKARAGRAA